MENPDESSMTSWLTFGMGIGWKIFIWKGFFAEPSFYYVYSKDGNIMPRVWLPGLYRYDVLGGAYYE